MKFAASSTLKRAGASVALTVALLSATGCGYIYHQPTTIHYAASDGVNADVADVDFRNIMVIAENKDSNGRILGTILNNGDKDATVEMHFATGTKTLTVPAKQEVRLEDDAHKIIVSPAGEAPGMMLEGTKVSVGSDSTSINVPVLDGTLEEYKQYLPNAASADASATSPASASTAQ